ncbi:helix-turn-helix transcriptional regulator [Monashia sp. NPDC004114]
MNDSTITELPPIVHTKELAAYLGVPVATVHAWDYNGKGPKRFRLGKHRVSKREDVLAWLDSLAAEADR